LKYGALELLCSKVTRPEVYTKALAAAITNQNWRQSLRVIEFLLSNSAYGEPVETAYVSAAGNLDLDATVLLARCIDRAEVDSCAFSAATANALWLLPDHLELMRLLYGRGVTPEVVEPALIAAAKALNIQAVELLTKDAGEHLVAAAFESATSDGTN
jgi:hypothetical protein